MEALTDAVASDLLWQRLQQAPEELTFVRDVEADGFVLPFYCEAAHLALEVRSDPPSRKETKAREPWQDAHRVDIMHVEPGHVLDNVDEVAGAILDIAEKRRARFAA